MSKKRVDSVDPHKWMSVEELASLSGLSSTMRREQSWMLRYLKLISANVLRVRFGYDNPTHADNVKEPDFILEVLNEDSVVTRGVELVSAYSRDELGRPSIDPRSSFPSSTDEWMPTVNQWKDAIRLEITKKLSTKEYTKEGLDSLSLLVCDETNGKDSLLNGHKYVQGRCFWLLYDPAVSGTPFTRLTAIQKSGEGLASSNSAGFDFIETVTTKDEKGSWLVSGVILNDDQASYEAKLFPVLCKYHKPRFGHSFGINKPYTGSIS